MLTKKLTALVVLSAILLAGCGGGGVADELRTRLNLTPGSDFNGTVDAIDAGNAQTSSTGGHTVAVVTLENRTLTFDIPAAEIHSGDEFDVGADGTTAVYTEVRTQGGTPYRWVGTEGHLTVNATTDGNQANISVSGLKFTADLTVEANPARGSFTMDGNVNGIPIAGGGGIGGQATLTFAIDQTTNADLSSFSDATVVFGQVEGGGTLSATTGDGESRRVLAVFLTAAAQPGDVVDLSNAQNGRAAVTFSQGGSQNVKVWTARAGTLTVVSRTDTTAKVRFTEALFTGTSGSASGAFRINGTLTRR